MTYLILLVAALSGAFGRRIVGGWLGLRGAIVRPAFIMLHIAIGALLSSVWWHGALIGLVWSAAWFVPRWGEAMDIGRAGGTRWGDAVSMAARFAGVIAIAAAVEMVLYGSVAWVYIAVVPVAIAGAYVLAWQGRIGIGRDGLIDGPTAAGEMAAGGLWVAALAYYAVGI